jgi:hypothetical protein
MMTKKRRKKKTRQNFNRVPQKVILIVCEGEVEKAYFEEFVKHLGLNPASIDVKAKKETGGNDPRTILNYAKKAYEEFGGYDEIFCVFDKDDHSHYDEVRKEIKKLREGLVPIHAIISNPCFEYWLLLHFKCSSAQFPSTQTKTKAENCIKELKKYLPEYKKGRRYVQKIALELFGRIEEAKNNAKKIQETGKKDGFDEPFTNVNEIIEYLQSL